MECLSVLLILTSASPHAGGPTPRERFFTEYPKFAARMVERAERPGVGRMFEETVMHDKSPTSPVQHENRTVIHTFYVLGNKRRIDTEKYTEEKALADLSETGRPPAKKSSMVYDGELMFYLSLDPAQKMPKVNRMERGDLSPAIRSALRQIRNAPFSLQNGQSPVPTSENSSVRVKDVTEVGPADKRRIHVEFERISKNPKFAGQVGADGWFELDPSRGWVLVSSRENSKVNKPTILDRTLEYERVGEDYELKRMVEVNTIPGDNFGGTKTFTIAFFRPGAATEEDFKLSTFQLPDVGKTPVVIARSKRASYWLFGLACAALLASALLGYLAYRKRGPRKSPGSIGTA